MAFLSYQWRDGVFTLRLELKRPAPPKKRAGPRPLPPPFPLPPLVAAKPVRSWLDVEPTTVGPLDPAATLDAPAEPEEEDLPQQRRSVRRALKNGTW